MKQIIFLFFAVLTLLSGGLRESSSAYAAGGVVREIQIKGAQRIEPATVLSYLNVRTGDLASDDLLNQALKSLFATGMFADIKIREQGGVLFVDVVENPLINEIAFEGNKKIKDDELMAEISLRPRQVYTKTKLQNDLSRVYQLYQKAGRFAVAVDPKIIQLDQNRVNLVFEIHEGDVTAIKGIRFVGNKQFTDSQLRAEVSTKEKRWYRFFSSDDRYDEDRVQFDTELLRRFYLHRGYADFRVVSTNAELTEDKESFYLTYTVEEGPRYKIGSIAIDSALRGYDATGLRDEVTILPGEWYDSEKVQASVDLMSKRLGDVQYAFADIDPQIQRNSGEQSVDLVFVIGESPRVFVERIDIEGNVRTIDKVIRRQMLLVEGDPFSRSKLSHSEQAIRDLGYFEQVEVKSLPGSAPDKTILRVSVTEQSTGELSIGAGFSTQDGPLADLRIRERNLLGKGQDLTLSTTLAGTRTEFDASFTEPYFLDRDLSAGVDAFHVTRDLQSESSYDQQKTGGALRMGYPLSEKWRQSLKYRLEEVEVSNVDNDASRYIREQEGKRITSALSQRLAYDGRDSSLFPTDGLYSWLDLEGAGIGGDAKYVSGDIGASYYIPFFEKKVVFNLFGETGAIQGIGGDVEINERYFLGGNNLRGFAKGGIGPRDTFSNDALGGNLYYRGTAELSFPVGLPAEMGVSGHAFNDVGSLWSVDETGVSIVDDNSMRAAAGLGLSWRSPMGPLRVDFAFPYIQEDYDDEENFRFSFGTRF